MQSSMRSVQSMARKNAEASRYAIKEALSDVLVRFEDANLLDLTEAQRLFAVETYLALDVFRRFELDNVGTWRFSETRQP